MIHCLHLGLVFYSSDLSFSSSQILASYKKQLPGETSCLGKDRRLLGKEVAVSGDIHPIADEVGDGLD